MARGGAVLGAGYAIASIGGGANFTAVLVGVGLVGGTGIGLGYVVPIAVGMRWFPDHKGMITGVAVAGNNSVARNYPWGFLSYGVGGIVFPILGGWLGDLGNFPLAFEIAAGMCFVGAVATSLVFPPHHDEAERPFSVHGFLHNAHLFEPEPAQPANETELQPS